MARGKRRELRAFVHPPAEARLCHAGIAHKKKRTVRALGDLALDAEQRIAPRVDRREHSREAHFRFVLQPMRDPRVERCFAHVRTSNGNNPSGAAIECAAPQVACARRHRGSPTRRSPR
jgi:hypothetical protein